LPDGALKAVLGSDIEMNSVIDNVKAIHPMPKPISTLMPTMNAASIASPAGAHEPLKMSADGRAVLLRGATVPGTDWTVIVALDAAEARAGVRSMLTSSAIAFVLIVLMASRTRRTSRCAAASTLQTQAAHLADAIGQFKLE